MGQVLEPDKLKPSDIQGSFLDNQVHLLPEQFLGRLKFLGCLHKTVTCFDSHFLCNLDLAQALAQEDYAYIKDGILSVILRKETKVGGEFIQVRDLDHLHDIWKNSVKMYEDPTAKDPEQELNLKGYYASLADALASKTATIVRNPSVQPQFEYLCDTLLGLGVVEEPSIKLDWQKTIADVRGKVGYIPGRKQLYEEAKKYSSNEQLRNLTNWSYYTSMWNTVAPSSSIDYPPDVMHIQNNAERMALRRTRKAEFIRDLERQIPGIFDLASVARVPYQSILEIRDKHSKDWWEVCNKKEFDVQEMFDVFEPLYGAIIKTSGGMSLKGSSRVRLQLADLGLKAGELGLLGVGFLLSIQDPLAVSHYSIIGAGLAVSIADYFHSKKDEQHELAAIGRGAISKIKPGLVAKYRATDPIS